MPCATLSRVSKPYQFTPEIRKGWFDGLRICVPLVRHPPGTLGTEVEVGATVGVGPAGVGVFVGGLAAKSVPEAACSRSKDNIPITVMLGITDLRVISFLLRRGFVLDYFYYMPIPSTGYSFVEMPMFV